MNDTVFGPSTSLNKKKQVSTSFPTSFACNSPPCEGGAGGLR